jgi:hypothetical protein
MQPKFIGIGLALAFALLIGGVGAAAAVGPGMACDGFIGIKCDGKLWCEHPAGQCFPDAMGTCVKTPVLCPKIWRPVCGCNGRTYGNDCERTRARAQKSHDGPCK